MQDNDTLGLGPSEQVEVQQDFEAAASCLVSAIAAHDKRFTDKLKLQLYGLYKQALTGKCNTSKPGFWDPTGRAKWYVVLECQLISLA